MEEGKLPNFKRFYDCSEVFVSVADAQAPQLEPWIQWYSMHTGLAYKQHGVYHLTEGVQAEHEDIWRMLMAAQKKVASCCSMNARAFSGTSTLYIPDPWCTTEQPYPEEYSRFYKVVSHLVQEYTNKEKDLSKSDYFSFVRFLLSHGLRVKTMTAIARQLASEFVTSGETSWRRVPILDKLQLDLFSHYWLRKRPDFATFFVNSTAHYQHAYWRHMSPESFEVPPPEKEIDKYKDAILFGYQEMDRLLKFFAQLESAGATLILASALSQQPFLKYEKIGGQHFYRPRDIDSMLLSLGIRYRSANPVMTHQYVVHFDSEEEARNAQSVLSGVRYRGQEVFAFMDTDPDALYFGNRIRIEVPEQAQVSLDGEQSRRFFDLFYKIDAIKSGCHHPDGVLWFKTGTPKVYNDKVSILDVLPTILNTLEVPLIQHKRLLGKVLPLSICSRHEPAAVASGV